MKKRDYKIIIQADNSDNVYWNLLRKGEQAACNEEEIRMVSSIFAELKTKIDKQYSESKREEKCFDSLFTHLLSSKYKQLLKKWHCTLTPDNGIENMTEESKKAYNDINEYCEFIEKYFGFCKWEEL